LAAEIVSRAGTAKASKQARSSARRIQKLSAAVVSDLLAEKAPYRVVRWVAWADQAGEQRQRADLVLHLHRALERPSHGWLDEGHLKVALGVWLRERADARECGRMPPAAREVQTESYAAAIAAVPRRRRGAPAKLPTPVACEDEVLRVLRGGRASRGASKPGVVGEDEVLRVLIASLPSTSTKSTRPARPVLKLRTGSPARIESAQPRTDNTRTQAENARLRDELLDMEAEGERKLAALRAENARVAAENQRLREELSSSRGGAPWWAVGLGAAAAAAEIVRLHVALSRARADRDKHREPAPGETAEAAPRDDEALFKGLLPVFDNLTRAVQHAEGAPEKGIAEGLRMVRDQLDDTLAKSGVQRVPTVGHAFDPARHQAVEHIESPQPAGVVIREVLPGYMAGDRLLRAPLVVVSKGVG
jgi:molecular chaperone GrpE